MKLLRDRAVVGCELKTVRLLRSQVPQTDVEFFRGFVNTLELLDEDEWSRRMELPEVCLERDEDWWKPWGHDL